MIDVLPSTTADDGEAGQPVMQPGFQSEGGGKF